MGSRRSSSRTSFRSDCEELGLSEQVKPLCWYQHHYVQEDSAAFDFLVYRASVNARPTTAVVVFSPIGDKKNARASFVGNSKRTETKFK